MTSGVFYSVLQKRPNSWPTILKITCKDKGCDSRPAHAGADLAHSARVAAVCSCRDPDPDPEPGGGNYNVRLTAIAKEARSTFF